MKLAHFMVGESNIRAMKNTKLTDKSSRKNQICFMNTWQELRLQLSPCVFFVSSVNRRRQLPAAADYTGICFAVN
jgi:hypothetical protein